MMKSALADCGMSESGQKRKSATTVLMSVKRPKAEVLGDGPVIQFPIMSRRPNAKTAR